MVGQVVSERNKTGDGCYITATGLLSDLISLENKYAPVDKWVTGMSGVSLCETLGSVINGHTGDNNGVTSTHSSGCGKQNGAEHLDENKSNVNMETQNVAYM